MCGIVGYVGDQECAPILLESLRRLEYRGYDSAGIAVFNGHDEISIVRSVGNLDHLTQALSLNTPEGKIGIGHTRWATHGKPSEENAHPHVDCTGRIAVVHNGIIENFSELRTDLIAGGHKFLSETDTEVIAHLIEEEYARAGDHDLSGAIRAAIDRIDGTFAIGVASLDHPGKIIGARKDSPLVVGIGSTENYLASAIPALLPYTRSMLAIENDELVEISAAGVHIYTLGNMPVEREPFTVNWDVAAAEKGGYEDFMLKEIYEQPAAFRDTIRGRFKSGEIMLDELKMTEDQVRDIKKIIVVACGTSYHAGLLGKYLIEKWARVPVEVDYASEFRYRNPILDENTLVLAISQSGETADTLAGVRKARERGAKVLAVVNVVGSLLSREADILIQTHAGPEVGVAATKTFISQLAAMYLVALYLGKVNGTLDADERHRIASELKALPAKIEHALKDDCVIRAAAVKYARCEDFLFLGRGVGFPIALEGALKLKEISYIHAEGYAAGEMKHGPIALLDEDTPVVAIATKSAVLDKVLSNVQESKARGSHVLMVTTEGDTTSPEFADAHFEVPECDEMLSPVLSVLPLQLLSYHIAKARGCNVDQPRNLAKSVTVE